MRLFFKINKTHFLLCKYFAAISVASSEQVTLQFYFQIFYSTAPNKIVIKLTKLKRQNVKLKCLGYIKQLVYNEKHIQQKKSSKYAPVESVQTKSIKTSINELFSKTTG